MKKSVLSIMLCAAAVVTLHAQTALMGTRTTDNWSVGLRLGGTTPLTHSSFFGGMRPAMGLELSKQLTPVFGLSLQGMGYINTSSSATAFDVSDVALLSHINLHNLIGGYRGVLRGFEVAALAGIGWMHHYRAYASDRNDLSGRIGVDFLFNLDEARAWTVGIRPMLLYNLTGDHPVSKVRFNANRAYWEWTAGVIYHFRGSNGERFFTWVPVLDIAEREAMNEEINRLRGVVCRQEKELKRTSRQVDVLMSELQDCGDMLAMIEEGGVPTSTPVASVLFRQGQSVIDAAQCVQVERVAKVLQMNPDLTLSIEGYASPEGPEEYNRTLSQARAEAVKRMLVEEYGIEPERISAQGLGVGDMFSNPRWNRITLCIIEN